jgi:hypothetical protein
MSEVKNLWGNIEIPVTSDTDSCINLLLEQVKLLESQTNGLLKGKVTKLQNSAVSWFDLTLIAPKLNGYRYTFLKVAVGFHPYPVFMYDRGQCGSEVWEKTSREFTLVDNYLMSSNKIPTEEIGISLDQKAYLVGPATYKAEVYEEFEEYLAKILQSDGTKEVISVLLSKSQSIL